MTLYDYTKDYLKITYPELKEQFDTHSLCGAGEYYLFLVTVWDCVNQWSSEYTDEFLEEDAAFVVKLLNETLIFVSRCTKKEPISLSDIANLCSLYAKCCLFAKNEMYGSDLYEKCKFIVNNTIADCIVCEKEPCIELADLYQCNPDEDCWEEL